jgi:sugar phosphate isomerase/epimerase
MALTYKSSAIPASFASCSFLSPKSGNLADRMRALRESGFDGMELSMPDLLSYGAVLEGRHLDDTEENVILKTALQVRKLAADLGLKIVMLQPFMQFEGWPRHSDERREAFDRAERWFKIMAAVGTDMLQVHGYIFQCTC